MHDTTPSSVALIPRKTDHAERLFTSDSSIIGTWSRRERYIFQLIDGKRTVERIASLLMKSVPQIEDALGKFLLNGWIALNIQDTLLFMDVKVLYQSLPVLQAQQDFFIEAFSTRLLELYPDEPLLPRSVFHPDSFVPTFSRVIQHLHSGEDIASFIQSLGQLHATMGVSKEQYALLRRAALEVLQQVFREQPSVQRAWTWAYDILVREMRYGGKLLTLVKQNSSGGSAW